MGNFSDGMLHRNTTSGHHGVELGLCVRCPYAAERLLHKTRRCISRVTVDKKINAANGTKVAETFFKQAFPSHLGVVEPPVVRTSDIHQHTIWCHQHLKLESMPAIMTVVHRFLVCRWTEKPAEHTVYKAPHTKRAMNRDMRVWSCLNSCSMSGRRARGWDSLARSMRMASWASHLCLCGGVYIIKQRKKE